jgi:hypothetical protein
MTGKKVVYLGVMIVAGFVSLKVMNKPLPLMGEGKQHVGPAAPH